MGALRLYDAYCCGYGPTPRETITGRPTSTVGIGAGHATPALLDVRHPSASCNALLILDSAYNLDRNVCTALGRPSSLPDAWIDVPVSFVPATSRCLLTWPQFPSIMDDALIGPDYITPGEPSPLKAIALHRYRLRVLHSEIHNRLYITRPDIVPISPEWYVSVVERLNEWRDTLPLDSDLCTTEWWLTKYHLTLILLYRSSPANLNPDQTQLSKALLSAGAVMSAYREQYRKGAMNFSMSQVR